MLLHPLVWSNTAIVSCLGPSQLLSPVGPVPLYLLSLSSPRPAQVGRQLAAGPALERGQCSAKYASLRPNHIPQKANPLCSNIISEAETCFDMLIYIQKVSISERKILDK